MPQPDTTRRDFLKASGAAIASGALFELTGCSAPPLSPAQSALASFDGVGLAEQIRRGTITPRELMEETLLRIDSVNPQLNAVIPALFDPEIALERASGTLSGGPLSGVPVLLKNMIEYDQARMDYGSRMMARANALGLIPKQPNSPFVEAMLGSGMVIAGVTNTPEFGLIETTEPVLHGPTRNPWNLEYTPGGSSGGSAAAVAAGIVHIAHANDGGGSIRIPASHCGVFGLKPTRGRERGSGRVFGPGSLNIFSDMCVSRSVRDTAAFLSVVEQRSNPELPPVGRVRRSASAKRLRIALALDGLAAGSSPHAEVVRAARRSAELCEELGHEVTEAKLPIDAADFADAFVGLWAMMALSNLELCRNLFGADVDATGLLETWTLGLAEIARERGAQACAKRASESFTRASVQMQTLFETYDVVLSPVESVPPFPLGVHDTMGDFETIFERVMNDCSYTPLNNATGMPGMSVPLHWTPDGLPVGVQFSAWLGGEATLLQLAYELEEARPWAERHPLVSVM